MSNTTPAGMSLVERGFEESRGLPRATALPCRASSSGTFRAKSSARLMLVSAVRWNLKGANLTLIIRKNVLGAVSAQNSPQSWRMTPETSCVLCSFSCRAETSQTFQMLTEIINFCTPWQMWFMYKFNCENIWVASKLEGWQAHWTQWNITWNN